jgi:hypothetical protein
VRAFSALSMGSIPLKIAKEIADLPIEKAWWFSIANG